MLYQGLRGALGSRALRHAGRIVADPSPLNFNVLKYILTIFYFLIFVIYFVIPVQLFHLDLSYMSLFFYTVYFIMYI